MREGTIKILSKIKSIKEIVNNPEWISLRESLVGTWQEKPLANVRKLRKYLGENPQYEKLRRTLNYLTGSAFRSKTIKHPAVDSLREWVKNKLKQLREEK